MKPKLEDCLSLGKPLPLDNPQIDFMRLAWQVLTTMDDLDKPLREQILSAMERQNVSVADLERMTGVKYHTIDKWLRGITRKTSAENMEAMKRALGVGMGDDPSFAELRKLYFDVPEEMRQFVVDSVRGLLQRLR